MKAYSLSKISSVQGFISLPGDKSIAHRAVILGAVGRGRTVIRNFPFNKDCLATVRIMRELGVAVARGAARFGSGIVRVTGRGLHGLRKPRRPLIVHESGTTFRLILGLLAGQDFPVIMGAGASLKKRPMLRVTAPLRLMGARIKARRSERTGEEYPPVAVCGGRLRPVAYTQPVASAQVKSALLLAGLYASGQTRIIERVSTRDHTERMLRLFKADIGVSRRTAGAVITVRGKTDLISPRSIDVPGDISSAAFFIVLASLVPGSLIRIRNVCLNPSRLGIIDVLKRMHAGMQIRVNRGLWEPSGDITVAFRSLKGTLVHKKEIPLLIDELPVLMVAACCAEGNTVLKGVGELRLKETDRIVSMTGNLKKLGASIEIRKGAGREDIVIKGGRRLVGTRVQSFGDHRTAMSMIVAGMVAEGKTVIDDVSCIDKSFPGFLSLLKKIVDPK